MMKAKENIIQLVEQLRANAAIEDAMERLLFLVKVEKGLKQADEGETLSHIEFREMAQKNGGRVSKPAFQWRTGMSALL